MTNDKRSINNSAWFIVLKMVFTLLLVMSTYYLGKEMPIVHYQWPHWDKVQHLALFFCITLLGLYLFRQYRISLISLLLVYGALAEYYQSIMTLTRTGSIADWLADLAGVCLACLLAWGVALMAKRRHKQHE
jgi:VanZ family protein